MSTPRFVRRWPFAENMAGREFAVEWGDQSFVRELRVWYSLEGYIAALQVLWETDDGAKLRSRVLGAEQWADNGSRVPHDAALSLSGSDVMNGLHGYADPVDGRIHAIGIVTQHETLPILGWDTGDAFRWTLADHDDETESGALVTGLYGSYDRTVLRAVGLRISMDGVGPQPVRWGPGGRVIPLADVGKPPQLDHARAPVPPAEHPDNADRLDVVTPTPPAMRPNPNHRQVDVRRIDQWDDVLRIHTAEGASLEFRYVKRQLDRSGRHWIDVYQDSEGRALGVHLRSSGTWLEFTDGTAPYAGPAPPTPAASDGPTWDNVFSLDHRVDYLAWAARGIDASRLAPFNLQESPGALLQEVFELPAPGSRDFHITADGKATVVPNGWQFMSDVTRGSTSRTTSAFTDEESRRSWATSLGISAEADVVGAKMAYRNNSKAHGDLSTSSSDKTVSTIVESVEISHSLVVDLANVRLCDGFRRAVGELSVDPSEERIIEFLARFGTHFARAVTFGSKTWEQRHETEESLADNVSVGSSSEQSLEVGYHNEIGGMSGSVSVGTESTRGGSSKVGSGTSVSSSGSVGSASGPVPIMLELEDITHLLGPVFFDDPYVHTDLRRAMDQTLDMFPVGFDFEDDSATELTFALHPPANVAAGRIGRCVAPFAGAPEWLIRFGFRHRIDRASLRSGEFEMLTPGVVERVADAELDAVPDSREIVSLEGAMVRAESEPTRVWWIDGGKRHVVPTTWVLDVLGGWNVVRTVEPSALEHYGKAKTPTSVNGKMIRVEGAGAGAALEVWLIHGRQRHRIQHESGVKKRGGWQRVAVVPKWVRDTFPDSGSLAP